MDKKTTYVVGNQYIIDKDYRNGGTVILLHVYGKLFCRVKDCDSEYEWDTMLYRLSEINEN